MEWTGNVICDTFAPGSKSEHPAVFLETANGRYKLERVGGNPFHDPEIEGLVGKRIKCSGELLGGHTLRMNEWKVL